MKGPLCSEEILEEAIKFKHSGEVLNKDGYTKVSTERAKVVKDCSQFKPYYQDVFKQFDQNNGSFIPKWNSPAFLFGFFWYLAKGMWLKGLIMVAITVSFGEYQQSSFGGSVGLSVISTITFMQPKASSSGEKR